LNRNSLLGLQTQQDSDPYEPEPEAEATVRCPSSLYVDVPSRRMAWTALMGLGWHATGSSCCAGSDRAKEDRTQTEVLPRVQLRARYLGTWHD
jgi:hypothetical protein